jgi:hypothetical protein
MDNPKRFKIENVPESMTERFELCFRLSMEEWARTHPGFDPNNPPLFRKDVVRIFRPGDPRPDDEDYTINDPDLKPKK